jgi:hypothetical protein
MRLALAPPLMALTTSRQRALLRGFQKKREIAHDALDEGRRRAY